MKLLLATLLLAAAAEEAPKAAVDQAVVLGVASLKKFCLEGDMKVSPASLRSEAETMRNVAELFRSKDMAQKQGQQCLEQAKAAETKAAALLKQADEWERRQKQAPRDLAPSFTFQCGLGEIPLIGLALVQAGMRPSDPLLQEAWARLSSANAKDIRGNETYILGVGLMFVDRMMHAPCKEPWPPAEKKAEVASWIQKAAETLAKGCKGGAWTYDCSYCVGDAPLSPKRYTVSGDLLGSKALKAAAVPKGEYDYSNTQYAVLGLKAAALAGAKIPDGNSLWRLVLEQFLDGQAPDGKAVKLKLSPEQEGAGGIDLQSKGWEPVEGYERCHEARARGWGYTAILPLPKAPKGSAPAPPPWKESPRPSMTVAGLTALLVARSELKLGSEEKALVDTGIRDALAWFQESGLGLQIPAPTGIEFGYYLYGLERLGVLGNLRTVGGQTWYAEGARFLVGVQAKDGSWTGSRGQGVETSFAILFLTRGTRSAYRLNPYEVVDSP